MRLRRRRDVQLRSLIRSIAADTGSITILDLGGTLAYWRRVGLDFLREVGARITIVNIQPRELSAEGTGVEGFAEVVGDACHLDDFADDSFELVHSNSVVEHVLTWSNMKAFAAETRRVGKNYYVQTPYFWFPIDPHFYRVPMFHWLPRPVRARLLNRFPIAYVGKVIPDVDLAFQAIERTQLLDARQFRFLFPDAAISFERFVGLPKSLIAIREEGRLAPDSTVPGRATDGRAGG